MHFTGFPNKLRATRGVRKARVDCIRETGRAMQQNIKEHNRDIRIACTQTSAVSEHVDETGHVSIYLGRLKLSLLIVTLTGTHVSRHLCTSEVEDEIKIESRADQIRWDINECEASPCKNGATCENQPGGYSCSCMSGYTGQNCEQDINECANDPCLNGATCHDEVGRYTCECPAGYEGTNCETVFSSRVLTQGYLPKSILIADVIAISANHRPVEAAPDIPATAATGTPITIPTPVSEVATAPEDRAAVTAPRQTTE
ncbi:hypothetical protein ACROYT_G025609 [Oculina patagonica]